MISIDHNEALLFRLLTSFFGNGRVIPHMSVLAACGGELPQAKAGLPNAKELSDWARRQKCLFTIVNEDDVPRLVVELSVDTKSAVDLLELQKQEQMRPILVAAGVPLIIVSKSELAFVTDPESPNNWFHLLQSKFEEAAAALAA